MKTNEQLYRDERDELDERCIKLNEINAALLAACEAALTALEYCAVEPGYLHALNNQQHVVASNALPELRAAIAAAKGE